MTGVHSSNLDVMFDLHMSPTHSQRRENSETETDRDIILTHSIG